jgi:hypothetical protein
MKAGLEEGLTGPVRPLFYRTNTRRPSAFLSVGRSMLIAHGQFIFPGIEITGTHPATRFSSC